MATRLGILEIPPEITEHALIHAAPRDVANFAATCRSARGLVYDARDQHLWRRLFLAQSFDDPRAALTPSAAPDWRGELQRRVRAARVARNISDAGPTERCRALQTLIAVVMDAAPATDTGAPSGSLAWLAAVVEESGVFRCSPGPWARGDEETQLLARLRTYVGLSAEDKNGPHSVAMRTAARVFVYDLRNYSRENMWGPFLPDKSGRVNWRHVEAIVNVIAMNLEDMNLWPDTRPPLGLEATRPYSAPGVLKRDPRDWAGVEGHWRRYVCFMDYRDLFAFNFSSSENGPHDASFFDDEDFQEAVRLIEVQLHLTHVTETRDPARPTIHFSGMSRGAHGNEAKVVGTVRTTPEGHVRWRFSRKASIYDGHSQWSSEGIQIGNVGSAAGVVGTWTGAHHEEGDPAGPFWLWKVDEHHPRRMGDGDS